MTWIYCFRREAADFYLGPFNRVRSVSCIWIFHFSSRPSIYYWQPVLTATAGARLMTRSFISRTSSKGSFWRLLAEQTVRSSSAASTYFSTSPRWMHFWFLFYFQYQVPLGGLVLLIRRLPSANNGNDERFDKNRSTVAVQSAPINGHLGDTSMIYFDFGNRNDSE